MNGELTVSQHLRAAGDEEQVIIFKGDVGHGAFQQVFQVDSHHFQGEVILLTVHHSPFLVGILA